jgi:hypothetical protein
MFPEPSFATAASDIRTLVALSASGVSSISQRKKSQRSPEGLRNEARGLLRLEIRKSPHSIVFLHPVIIIDSEDKK